MPGACAKGAFRGINLHTEKKQRNAHKKKTFENDIVAVR